MSRNTMTRMHFQLIAETIREARHFRMSRDGGPVGSTVKETRHYAAQLEALESLAKDFADRLADTNSGFRREQFLRACDPTEAYKPKRKMGNQNGGGERAQLEPYSDSELADRELHAEVMSGGDPLGWQTAG